MEKLEQAAINCINALADYVKADAAEIAINPRKRQALIAITLMQNALESASSKVPWEKAYEQLRRTDQMVDAITKAKGE